MTLSNITRSKPFYVAAGAGDIAVKAARELPSKLRPAAVQAEVTALPARAQSAAVTVAVGAVDRADAVYGQLLSRGRRVVGRIRRQRATQDLQRDANTTVRRTKAAARTVAEGADQTTSSAKRTARTARKSGAAARKSTGTATRSARKTTTTASKAVADGAAKVGT